MKAHTSQLTLGVERTGLENGEDYHRLGTQYASEQEVIDALRKRGAFKQVDFADRLSSSPNLVLRGCCVKGYRHFYEPMFQVLTLWVIPQVGGTPYVSEFEITDSRGNIVRAINHKHEDTFVAGWIGFPMVLLPNWSAKEVDRDLVIERFAAEIEEAAGSPCPKKQ